ncbi:hypothetical protein FGO68_gene14562 [Halteria grandinella]|uniref:Uncharacterized protein n=1 Tax=Halteria grandinella TaxID=5974 RepID=A0A8J8NX90_HALGN|nr:hypothetical protein FGO68_gene14562 [Halteria grandinella]
MNDQSQIEAKENEEITSVVNSQLITGSKTNTKSLLCTTCQVSSISVICLEESCNINGKCANLCKNCSNGHQATAKHKMNYSRQYLRKIVKETKVYFKNNEAVFKELREREIEIQLLLVMFKRSDQDAQIDKCKEFINKVTEALQSPLELKSLITKLGETGQYCQMYREVQESIIKYKEVKNYLKDLEEQISFFIQTKVSSIINFKRRMPLLEKYSAQKIPINGPLFTMMNALAIQDLEISTNSSGSLSIKSLRIQDSSSLGTFNPNSAELERQLNLFDEQQPSIPSFLCKLDLSNIENDSREEEKLDQINQQQNSDFQKVLPSEISSYNFKGESSVSDQRVADLLNIMRRDIEDLKMDSAYLKNALDRLDPASALTNPQSNDINLIPSANNITESFISQDNSLNKRNQGLDVTHILAEEALLVQESKCYSREDALLMSKMHEAWYNKQIEDPSVSGTIIEFKKLEDRIRSTNRMVALKNRSKDFIISKLNERYQKSSRLFMDYDGGQDYNWHKFAKNDWIKLISNPNSKPDWISLTLETNRDLKLKAIFLFVRYPSLEATLPPNSILTYQYGVKIRKEKVQMSRQSSPNVEQVLVEQKGAVLICKLQPARDSFSETVETGKGGLICKGNTKLIMDWKIQHKVEHSSLAEVEEEGFSDYQEECQLIGILYEGKKKYK